MCVAHDCNESVKAKKRYSSVAQRPPAVTIRAGVFDGENGLDVQREVLKVLDEVLSLNGRASAMRRDSPLLGVIPELDSMAVVTLITTLEDRFGFTIADDDLDASAFTTVGSLTDFVAERLTG